MYIIKLHKSLAYQFEAYYSSIINDCWIPNLAYKCLVKLCGTVMELLKLTPFISLIPWESHFQDQTQVF